MKIESSAVQLQSQRQYSKVSEVKSVSIQVTSASAHKLDLSDPTKSKFEQLSDVKDELELQAKQQKEEAKEEQKEAQKKAFENFLQQMKKNQKVQQKQQVECKSLEEMRIELMKRILKILRGEDVEDEGSKSLKDFASQFNSQAAAAAMAGGEVAVPEGGSENNGTTGVRGVVGAVNVRSFRRITVTSSFMAETENTAFQGQGMVRTSDGREIDFGITVEMSRAFCEQNETLTSQSIIMCDPLVINMGSDVAEVSDQKFLFDLDADGKKEEISELSAGSGYLALDKNGDGKINDGSELFGTKSGDGFGDLAAYDSDGNGWIDENDDVFSKLKVWTKDENGNDLLLDLKKADVGAIYLGKASTQFSLNSMKDNHTNGAIRSTGIYLKENGGVGTVQHVDLAL